MESDLPSAWQVRGACGVAAGKSADKELAAYLCRLQNLPRKLPHPRAFMKKLSALLLLTFTFTFTLTHPILAEPESPKSDGEATAAITQLREGLLTSVKKGDIDSLLTYLDPQVIVTWQNGEVCRGPAEVRAFYNRMMNGPKRVVQEIQSDPEVIGRRVYGDWAVAWGNLHDQIVLSNGAELPFNSVFTATIAKRGDRWLVVAFHTSINAFDDPVPSPRAGRMAEWVGAAGLFGGLVFGFMATRLFPRKKAAA